MSVGLYSDVVLTDSGPNRLAVIKAIRHTTKRILSNHEPNGLRLIERDSQRPHLMVYTCGRDKFSLPLDDIRSTKAIIDSTPKCIAGHIRDFWADGYKEELRAIGAKVSLESPATDYSDFDTILDGKSNIMLADIVKTMPFARSQAHHYIIKVERPIGKFNKEQLIEKLLAKKGYKRGDATVDLEFARYPDTEFTSQLEEGMLAFRTMTFFRTLKGREIDKERSMVIRYRDKPRGFLVVVFYK